jgi:hypothetical protein
MLRRSNRSSRIARFRQLLLSTLGLGTSSNKLRVPSRPGSLRFGVEQLEDRRLMAVNFLVGAAQAPAINQPDIGLGVVSVNSNFDEMLVRVNPTDPGNVIVSSHDGLRVSRNAGGTFDARDNFPNLAGGGNNGDTGMAFDSQGRLFWANLTTVNDGDLQVTQVNPTNGTQIGATVNIQTASGDALAGFDDKEFLAADRYPGSVFTDNLYTVWTKFGATTEVYFSRSTNQGAGWSAPLLLSNSAVENFVWPADVAVASNGNVFAAYHADISGNSVANAGDATTGSIFVLRSTDGGVTFPQKNQAFLPGQADLSFNFQNAAGTGEIPQTSFWTQGAHQPWILPDPVRGGRVYVIGNDDPDNNHGVGDDADVVIATSADNGLTWNRATVPDGAAGAQQLFPFASIDIFGNMVVAWYDTRRALTNANGNFLLDVFATYSPDGGATWAPAFQVNDPGNPFDPDFPGNQRRFPTPQTTPCNVGANETCRIGEYFGIDHFGGTAYVAWESNTRNAGGAVTGDQTHFSAFAIAGSLTVSGDDSGAPTNDTFTLRQVAGNPGFIEVLVNGQRQYAGLLDGVANGITINGLGGDDDLIVDYVNGDPVPEGGLHFEGGIGADEVVLTGTGSEHGTYLPDSLVTGEGTLTVDGHVITFSGLEPVLVSAFFEFTLVTPNSNDALTVDSPLAGSNRISGTSGSVAIEAITFFDIDHFKIDTAANDGPLANTNDAVTFSSDLVATGLLSLTIETGEGDDLINGSSVTAAASAGLTILAGAGNDTVTGGGRADRIDGGPGLDSLVGKAGNDLILGGDNSDTFVWDPGDGSDTFEGGNGIDVMIFNGSAGAEIFTFNAVGTRLEFLRSLGAIDMDLADVEQVDLNAIGGVDSVNINDVFGTAIQAINVNLGADGATDSVSIHGRSVADNLMLTTPGAGRLLMEGLEYNVAISGAEATDRLGLNGNDGDDQITAVPDTEAIMEITLNGGLGDDVLKGNVSNLNGNDGDDTLIGGAGNQDMDGEAGDDTFAGNGGADNVGGGAGSAFGDTIRLPGTAGVDTFALSLSVTGQLIATVNGVTTTYANFIGGVIASSGIEQILVQGLAGNDSLTVDSTNGTIPIPINYDGGNNADLLTLTGGNATSNTYAIGPGITEGTSTIVIGGVTQVVRFNALEPVIDLVAGPLVVVATNASNAINYTQGSVAANGLVSIDGFETIEFSNKTNLTINALSGDDSINLNNQNTPTGLTNITVNGGDPTGGSDTVIVNGSTAADAIDYRPSATPGSAVITGVQGVASVNINTAEHVTINGRGGGDTLTYTTPGGQDLQLSPAASLAARHC